LRFAGLRLREAAGLQLGDVDFMRRTLIVERQIEGQINSRTAETSPKYESARIIYLPDDVVTLLSRHVRARCAARRGRLPVLAARLRLQPQQRGQSMAPWVRRQVGIDEFTLLDLRHFYASGLIVAGCDVVTVQHALGHSSPSITVNTYSHLAQSRGPHSQCCPGPDVGGLRREKPRVLRTLCGFWAPVRAPTWANAAIQR